MIVTGIDPGPVSSGVAQWDTALGRFLFAGKLPNDEVRVRLATDTTGHRVAVERIESYGMPVGADVFSTCIEVGRFVEVVAHYTGDEPALVPRRLVKLHWCGTSKAKDSNVRQALVDRFAPGAPNHGKGTKGAPSIFYGFSADTWQAAALAVYLADMTGKRHRRGTR